MCQTYRYVWADDGAHLLTPVGMYVCAYAHGACKLIDGALMALRNGVLCVYIQLLSPASLSLYIYIHTQIKRDNRINIIVCGEIKAIPSGNRLFGVCPCEYGTWAVRATDLSVSDLVRGRGRSGSHSKSADYKNWSWVCLKNSG